MWCVHPSEMGRSFDLWLNLPLDVAQGELKISVEIMSSESQSHLIPNLRSLSFVFVTLGVRTLARRFIKINLTPFASQ